MLETDVANSVFLRNPFKDGSEVRFWDTIPYGDEDD